MTRIWGLDLKEMQWWKFKGSYMFKNTDYHLRRSKFVLYQFAMIFLVVSESLGTAVLSDYIDQQSFLEAKFSGISVFNNDYVGIASFNIFVGVFAAFVFGAAFFFDLFWPLRYEPVWVQWTWQVCAVLVSIAGVADALAYTVIVSRRGLILRGIEELSPGQLLQLVQALQSESKKTPVPYNKSARAVASVVLLWIGWVSAVASTAVMISFYRHVRNSGSAKAQHVQKEEEGLAAGTEKPKDNGV